MDYEDWSDQDLVNEIDERACARTDWEIDFVDDIVKQTHPLSVPQRAKIIQILEKDDE